MTYFPDLEHYNVGPEGYLELIQKLKTAVNIPVIASLNGVTPGGWIEHGKELEQAGADALAEGVRQFSRPAPLDADITAKELTVTGASADNKVYDGSTAASISGAALVGVVSNDTVALDSLAGAFAQAAVGTDIAPAMLELCRKHARQAGRDVGDTHYYEVFAAMRLAVAMIHTGDRLTAAGTVPASMNLAIHNPGTQVLADLLGIKYAWLSPGS